MQTAIITSTSCRHCHNHHASSCRLSDSWLAKNPAAKEGVRVVIGNPCLSQPPLQAPAACHNMQVSAGSANSQLHGITLHNILLSLVKQAAHNTKATAKPGVGLTTPLAWPCHHRPGKHLNNTPKPKIPCAHPITTHAWRMHTAANWMAAGAAADVRTPLAGHPLLQPACAVPTALTTARPVALPVSLHSCSTAPAASASCAGMI